MKNNKKIAALILFLYASVAAADTITIPDVSLKSKVATHKKNSTGGAYIQFTKEDIAKSPATNLSDFFRQEQSVVRLTNNSGDTSQTALSLRGFGDNAVANSLILIDGFALTNPSLLTPNFNSIPLSDIDHIDIFQGSAGTLWGNQAVGGVINIVTKHPKKFYTNFTANLGSYETSNFNFLVMNKWENGLFFKTFGMLGTTQNYRDHNQNRNNNIAGEFGLDYASGTVSVNAQTYGASTEFPGGLTWAQFKSNPQQATDFKDYSYYKTDLFQLLNKQELGPWLLETRLSNHQTIGNGRLMINFNRSDATTALSQRLTGRIKNQKWTLGYDAQQSQYELTNLKAHPSASENEATFYLQSVFTLDPAVDLTLGARSGWQNNDVNQVKSRNQVFVTEQGLVFHPSNQWSLYLRRDGNFSFPKTNENAWVPQNTNALNVQTGVSYEFGAELKNENQRTQISMYHLLLNNEIAFNPAQTPGQPFGSFMNLDRTERNGVTIIENYRFTPRFALDGQLNFVDARFAAGPYDGNFIPAVPAFNANLGLNYDWSDNWQIQYNLLYTGDRYPSEDLANVGQRVQGYWLHDVALQYFRKPYTLNFEVKNILDAQYASYAYLSSSGNIYFPAPGRSYLLTAKIDLD